MVYVIYNLIVLYVCDVYIYMFFSLYLLENNKKN